MLTNTAGLGPPPGSPPEMDFLPPPDDAPPDDAPPEDDPPDDDFMGPPGETVNRAQASSRRFVYLFRQGSLITITDFAI